MRSEKVMGALEKIQSDVIVAQSAISAVQMLAEKIPGGQIVSKGLEKMNLMLGVANVGISFAEAGIEFSSHQNKQAEQFLLYGALDIFGNMVTISDVNEYSTNSFIRNVLTKGKTIGTYTEYLMAGQSEVLAYNDFKSGNMTSAIEITAANVLNIGFAGREAFGGHEHSASMEPSNSDIEPHENIAPKVSDQHIAPKNENPKMSDENPKMSDENRDMQQSALFSKSFVTDWFQNIKISKPVQELSKIGLLGVTGFEVGNII